MNDCYIYAVLRTMPPSQSIPPHHTKPKTSLIFFLFSQVPTREVRVMGRAAAGPYVMKPEGDGR
jgi:hypothetical protein